MGDHQRRPGVVNLGPFVGVDLNNVIDRPYKPIAVIVLYGRKMNQINKVNPIHVIVIQFLN